VIPRGQELPNLVLPAEASHSFWSRSIPPLATLESGDVIRIATRDANDGFYNRTSTDEDARRKPAFTGHPLTGPIAIKDAEPGQTLLVTVLDIEVPSWGFTAFYPGRGLLPQELDEAHVQIWDLSDGLHAHGIPGIRVPLAPFPGIIGVAPDSNIPLATSPPMRSGGNLDIRQATRGAEIQLPIEVAGALLSVGDVHAAQGEGEVCTTAIEIASAVTLRLEVTDAQTTTPRLHTPALETLPGPAFGVAASHHDLHEACKRALLGLIDWLTSERGLSREDAYILSSVVGQLRLSQIVNIPQYTVTAFMPLEVFDDER